MLDLSALDFARQNGLVTVVTQDAHTGAVLMVAHADREALERTMETGEMHYRSRSRGLWHKGATSGNRQRVLSLAADCDGDSVLARVTPAGPACHTGRMSCFGDAGETAGAIGRLDAVIAERAGAGAAAGGVTGVRRGASAGDTTDQSGPRPGSRPGSEPRGAPPERQDAALPIAPSHPSTAPASYTARLLADRNLRLKKLGEEAAELITACADGDGARAAQEGMDVLYHTLVALRALGVTLDDLRSIARERAR